MWVGGWGQAEKSQHAVRGCDGRLSPGDQWVEETSHHLVHSVTVSTERCTFTNLPLCDLLETLYRQDVHLGVQKTFA